MQRRQEIGNIIVAFGCFYFGTSLLEALSLLDLTLILYTPTLSFNAKYISMATTCLSTVIQLLSSNSKTLVSMANPEICPNIHPIESQHVHRSRFCDIIGHNCAKQSIYENVILPLSLSSKTKNKLFCGIRRGAGNVS